MELINFSIGDDHVSLWYGDQRHDLHNNYEFQKLVFDPNRQTLELYWSPGIKLSFAGVYVFKTRQRDPEMPYSEDSCLCNIGFVWDEHLDDMDSFAATAPSKGCTHLVLLFMSDFSIKVGANSARIEFVNSTI